MSVNLIKIVPQSGYTPCACRDCMDIAISAEMRGTYAGPALCLPCVEAGCEIWHEGDCGMTYDCQRDDAYGEH